MLLEVLLLLCSFSRILSFSFSLGQWPPEQFQGWVPSHDGPISNHILVGYSYKHCVGSTFCKKFCGCSEYFYMFFCSLLSKVNEGVGSANHNKGYYKWILPNTFSRGNNNDINAEVCKVILDMNFLGGVSSRYLFLFN